MSSNDQELGRGEAPSCGEAIDFDFLRQQTFDDADLARDVLELFVAQATSLVPTLPDRPAREQGELAHRFVGSARGIGAWAAAEAAAAYEAASQDARQPLFGPLAAEFERVVACAQRRLAHVQG